MEHGQGQAGQAGAAAAAAPPNSIGRLSHELLACVLAHVPLAQRLGAAALVCRAWAAAAAAATRTISVQQRAISVRQLAAPRVAALSAWLAANGAAAAVASLEVLDSLRVGFRLPASQLSATLTSLSLSFLEVAVTSSAPDDSQQQAPSALAALTALSRLELSWCTVSLEGLAALRGLRQLELQWINVPEGEDLSAVVGHALPALAQLTRLALADMHCRDAALAQLSSLAQLQELSINCCAVTAASFAVPLPGSLTLLELHSAHSMAFGPSTTPGLAQATALRRLSVSYSREFQPAVLQQLGQLQELVLHYCTIMPGLVVLAGLSGLQHLALHLHASTADHSAALGCALPALAQLTRLALAGGRGDWRDAALAQLSSLAQLRELRINSDAVTAASFAVPLPGSLTLLEVQGAVGAAFSPSATPGLAQATALRALSVRDAVFEPAVLQQLTALQELTLLECEAPELFARRLPALTQLETDWRLVGSADDVAALAAACPSLASLYVAHCSKDLLVDIYEVDPLNVSSLAQLSGLTRLELRCRGGGGLELLRGLRSLRLRTTIDDGEALVGVCQCTRLEELWLEVEGSGFEDYHVQLRNKAPPGEAPDVVQQLCLWMLEKVCGEDEGLSLAGHCNAVRAFAPALRGPLRGVFDQARSSQARLRKREAQLAAQGQQLQEREAQLAQQAQELAAAQARVAQLEAAQQQGRAG